MADFTSSPMAREYYDDSSLDFTSGDAPKRLTTFTNVAGAAVSFVLIIGIAVWGYKLLVRDVSGIPVVKAASGEMRVRPEEPGGETASNQGLSVNVVAAVGTTAEPADRLILAPKPIDLAEEDRVMPASMVAAAPQRQVAVATPAAPTINADDVNKALESGDVNDLVAQLTAGVAPITDLAETQGEVVNAVLKQLTADEQQVAALAVAPGVRESMRPKKRPANRPVITQASLAQPTAEQPVTATLEKDADSLPAGTRLAQLGAFASPEVAREQWDQLSARFGPQLAGKTRIVQRAKSGGRVFYRLRAMGFAEIADARRFCSALVADNADCIPVVTR